MPGRTYAYGILSKVGKVIMTKRYVVSMVLRVFLGVILCAAFAFSVRHGSAVGMMLSLWLLLLMLLSVAQGIWT